MKGARLLALATALLAAGCSQPKSQPPSPTPPAPSSVPTSVGTSSAAATATCPATPSPAGAKSDFAPQPSKVFTFTKADDLAQVRFETGGDGWGNKESQYYRQQNAAVTDCHLVITAKREPFGGRQYTSARLTTEGTFTPQYGRIVWQDVTLPAGRGTWPALWLWPAGKKYGLSNVTPHPKGDEGSLNGEIDVMEWVGVEPDEVNCSAHAYLNHPGLNERSGQIAHAGNVTSQPHDYWLEWTPAYLKFGIDNQSPYFMVTKGAAPGPEHWPYDQPYFLVMNVAMGGDWGGMYAGKYGLGPDGVDPAFQSSSMTIGAIKYYPYVPA